MLFAAHVQANESVAPPGGEKRIFGITGYYSPLPNQSRYVRGSYEADVRLNGKGTNGADGTQVYPGMLAAPKTYPFGTSLFIPGLGVGTVHDRGGAIVPAGQRNQAYDRIDVWMGSGEEGLARALSWGFRIVEGVLYDEPLPDSFSYFGVPPASIAHLPSPNIISDSTTYNQSIESLQENLRILGYYQAANSGIYDENTKKAVLQFQLDNDVVSTADSPGAGNFGPKTKGVFAQVLSRIQKEKEDITSHMTKFLPAGMSSGSTGKKVAYLRQALKNFGFSTDTFNEKFNDTAEEAVKNFQLAYGVISAPSEYGAGVFGPKTQKKMFDLMADRQKNLDKPSQPVLLSSEFSAIQESHQPIPEPSLKKDVPLVPAPSMISIILPKSPGAIAGNAVASSRGVDEQMMVAEFGVAQ